MKLQSTVNNVLKRNPKLYACPYDAMISNVDVILYLAVGDSLTASGNGYHSFMQTNLRNAGYTGIVINRAAYSGYRIGDVYSQIETFIAANPNARVFTILLGTNDTKTTAGWFKPWEAKYYYWLFIRKIKTLVPDAVINILQIPWISPSTTDNTFLPAETWEASRVVINQSIKSIARRYGMNEAPDLYTVTSGKTDWYLADGLHFNDTGYRNIAPIFTDLLKQKPSYTADNNYLQGKTYTVSGGTPNGSYSDPGGTKLTVGTFSLAVNQQIGFDQAGNGGAGATINVDVVFNFGETAIINDIICIAGGVGNNYTPETITIYSWDGNTYTQVGQLTHANENATSFTGVSYFSHFTPDAPFSTKGLKLTYTKTYGNGAGSDWMMVGEISATKLTNYVLPS